MPRRASAEPTCTIVPRSRGSIRRSAACVPCTLPRYVTSVTRRNSSALVCCTSPSTPAIANFTQPLKQSERQKAQHRGTPLERLTVLAVEGERVAGRIRSALVLLLARAAAAALALPAHRGALAPEAKPVPERSASNHVIELNPP